MGAAVSQPAILDLSSPPSYSSLPAGHRSERVHTPPKTTRYRCKDPDVGRNRTWTVSYHNSYPNWPPEGWPAGHYPSKPPVVIKECEDNPPCVVADDCRSTRYCPCCGRANRGRPNADEEEWYYREKGKKQDADAREGIRQRCDCTARIGGIRGHGGNGERPAGVQERSGRPLGGRGGRRHPGRRDEEGDDDEDNASADECIAEIRRLRNDIRKMTQVQMRMQQEPGFADLEEEEMFERQRRMYEEDAPGRGGMRGRGRPAGGQGVRRRQMPGGQRGGLYSARQAFDPIYEQVNPDEGEWEDLDEGPPDMGDRFPYGPATRPPLRRRDPRPRRSENIGRDPYGYFGAPERGGHGPGDPLFYPSFGYRGPEPPPGLGSGPGVAADAKAQGQAGGKAAAG